MSTINNQLTREVIKPLFEKAGGFNPAEHGYTDADAVAKHYNTVFSHFVNNNATIAKLVPTHTGNALVQAVKKQTLTAITNKAVARLRADLEDKAKRVYGDVIDKNGLSLYSGILGVFDGVEDPRFGITYGFGVFAELVDIMVADLIELKDIRELRQLAKGALVVPGVKEVIEYFNANYCPGLITNTLLGIDAYVQEFTVAEGDQHIESLRLMIESQNITDSLAAYLGEAVESIKKQSTKVTEKPAPKKEEKEETTMITIAKEEYETLKNTVETQGKLLAENKATFELAEQQIDQQQAVINKQKEIIDEQQAVIDSQLPLIEEFKAEVAKLQSENAALKTKSTTKVESEMTTATDFKLNIDALKAIAPRPADKDKVTNKEDIKDIDVSAVIRARVATASTGKALNQKVRDNAPKAIVATANATHTGIDAVATAAHKATNFVAHTAHATVQHTTNAADYLLDAIAPSTESTAVSAFKNIEANKKDGAIVTVGGSQFKIVDGKYVAL